MTIMCSTHKDYSHIIGQDGRWYWIKNSDVIRLVQLWNKIKGHASVKTNYSKETWAPGRRSKS